MLEKNMKKMKNKKGFTLVELLVVMTIIMVLTVVGMINYGNANKKSRDAKRKSDLESVRVALEMYRQDNGSYPADEDVLVDDYIKELPEDPQFPTKSYTYVISDYEYTLSADLEIPEGENPYTVTNP
jgi:general secretion pathway protein G